MHTSLSHQRPSLAKRTLGIAAIAATVLLAACGSDLGSAKLKPLKPGAPRTEVLTAMGTGPISPRGPEDNFRMVNGYRHQLFITKGSQFEVIWYREDPGTLEDPITKKGTTPVVILGDTLEGWGWKFYDEYSRKMNLPNPLNDRARLDSIAKSQVPDSLKK